MAKTSMIRVRVEPELKEEVEKIFKKIGLSQSEAITLFYNQIKLYQGLPFKVAIPNEETLRTIKNTDAGINIIESENIDEMFYKLGI